MIRKWIPGANGELQNAAVSPFVWFFASVPAVAGIAFYDQSGWLAAVLGASVVLYHMAYRALARGRPYVAEPELQSLKTS